MGVLASSISPHRRGYASPQRVKVCLNTSIIKLIVLWYSLLNMCVHKHTLAWAITPLQFQWWHTGEGFFNMKISSNYSWMLSFNPDTTKFTLIRGKKVQFFFYFPSPPPPHRKKWTFTSYGSIWQKFPTTLTLLENCFKLYMSKFVVYTDILLEMYICQ